MKLEEFASPTYGLPSLTNDLNFVRKAILLDDKVVGSVIAHLTSEVSLILSDELSKLTKAKILKLCFTHMIQEIKKAGLEDTHVFILPDTDTHYRNFLMKHFKFVEATGLPMYLYPK